MMMHYSNDSTRKTLTTSLTVGLLTLLMFIIPNRSLAQDGAASVTADWPTYSSSDLHISFAYPPNWQLNIPNPSQIVIPADLPKEYQPPKEEPSQGYGGVLALSPPKGHVLEGNRIEITIQSYEIPEGQDLFAWVEEMQELSSLIHPYEGTSQTWIRDVTSQELRDKENMEQVLHAVTKVKGYGPTTQAVWFTHGRLVYVINSFAYSDEMQAILDALASSIEFAPDAPRTLNELYKAEQEWPSLKGTLDNFRASQGLVEECDIVCRDAKAAENIQPSPAPTPDPEIEQEERRYYEQLHEQGSIEQPASTQTVNVSGNQKALPSNWIAPVYGSWPVICGSGAHTGNAEFAVDASVPSWTSVYASYGGVVVASYYDTNYNPVTGTSYGNLILIKTNLSIADETREYYHAYAHLNWRFVSQGNNVTRGGYIGASGNTGNVGPHLHFHIRDQYHNPVDATPVLGFTPDLNYPSANGTCGKIESLNDAPIIVEPVAFSHRYQPRHNGHYWFCYSGGHTNECYMKSVPNNGANYNFGNPPPGYLDSPELHYDVYVPRSADYRIWVCGKGGNGNDDSLHAGINGYAASTSAKMTGYVGNSWVWKSETMVSTIAYFHMNAGDQTVNIWMREDGMRFDRVLLTFSFTDTPPNYIACGGH